jgi:hypothetical protein
MIILYAIKGESGGRLLYVLLSSRYAHKESQTNFFKELARTEHGLLKVFFKMNGKAHEKEENEELQK